MRELKFRAWKKNRGAFIEWSVGGEINANPGSVLDLYQSTYEGNELVIEQYTGLKDKDGRDIFEGDLLDTFDGTGVVSWNDAIAAFTVETDTAQALLLSDLNVGVIGNIHENKELLK